MPHQFLLIAKKIYNYHYNYLSYRNLYGLCLGGFGGGGSCFIKADLARSLVILRYFLQIISTSLVATSMTDCEVLR